MNKGWARLQASMNKQPRSNVLGAVGDAKGIWVFPGLTQSLAPTFPKLDPILAGLAAERREVSTP